MVNLYFYYTAPRASVENSPCARASFFTTPSAWCEQGFSEEPLFLERLGDKKCIAECKQFEEICLTRSVLEMAINAHELNLRQPLGNAERTTDLYKFMACTNFVFWIFSHAIHKNLVHVIPSCCANKIRQDFSNPTNVPYTGNKLFKK